MVEKIKLPFLVFGGITFAFGCYLVFILWKVWPIESYSLSQAGVFGDSFGVLTALFSAYAFGGVVLTLKSQKEDIKLTREDIKNQNFENNIFEMISVLNQMISSIDLRVKGRQTVTGRDCFFTFYTKFKEQFDDAIVKYNNTLDEAIERTFKDSWNGWRKDLSHYVRFLYNIFRYIDVSDHPEKKLYSSIVRSQLSDYELAIIFYNCLSRDGAKFKKLAEDYRIFDNLPDTLIVDLELKKKFNKSAFGE